MASGIAVVIPSIPPRNQSLLNRCLPSVWSQTVPPEHVSIAVDHDKEGAGPTRTRALLATTSEWVAFLDDDDQLLPHHLETLLREQATTEADIVWPWYTPSLGGGDPIACNRGKQWDPNVPHTFPITALVRGELARQCHFPPPINAGFSGDDWEFWMQMNRLGAKFHHVDEVTWVWTIDGQNTSGAPGRW